jgi:EpsD family peptidyl-prolyl cis-trans isomerase
LNHFEKKNVMSPRGTPSRRLLAAVLALCMVTALSACGKKEQKSGQALVSVNGEEITALQLNEELQRSGVQPAQQEAASKQLLEALIDRQLLQNEAARDKTDRDPKVVQAIERAKALIIAQAYMQKRVGVIARPSKSEVQAYFDKHPEFFSQRKQFDMRQLVIATKDMSDELKKAMDGAKSIDEVAAWLDTHQVKYTRNQVSRTTADLAPELGAKLLAMPKGQLFIIREGERSLLISIADVKDAPVTVEVAGPQIEQYLMNAKSKEAAAAEIARLRGAAKIEYFGKNAPPAAAPAAAPATSNSAADANAHGAADLK